MVCDAESVDDHTGDFIEWPSDDHLGMAMGMAQITALICAYTLRQQFIPETCLQLTVAFASHTSYLLTTQVQCRAPELQLTCRA